MLVVLMYHRVHETRFTCDPDALETHLNGLKKTCQVVVPGDPLHKSRTQICLTFDDAYFDFYHVVFPLLKKLNLKAVLAIPAGLITEDSNERVENRLKYQPDFDACQKYASLCTWKEINEMLASGLVIPASHGLNHLPLKKLDENSAKEISLSKQILEEKTGHSIETFIYPYGTMSRSIHHFVLQHYRYAMRIGSSCNRNWRNFNDVIYRINADDFWPQKRPFLNFRHRLKLNWRYLSNSMRLK